MLFFEREIISSYSLSEFRSQKPAQKQPLIFILKGLSITEQDFFAETDFHNSLEHFFKNKKIFFLI